MATSDIPSPAGSPTKTKPTGLVRWCFADRDTGRITIAQFPNWPLWLFIAALLVEILFHPTGRLGLVVTIIKLIGLTIWAIDEIIRGCNPWRRALGTGVLLYEIYTLLKTFG